MFFNKNKNMKYLISVCEKYISLYEETSIFAAPSCKEDLMKSVEGKFRLAHKEIEAFKDGETDYVKIAHAWLASDAYDLLVSGDYHIYYGQLNPLSCAKNLELVYKRCMDYALKNEYLTKEEYDQNFKSLSEEIKTVG